MKKDAIHGHNSVAPELHFVLSSSFYGVPYVFLCFLMFFFFFFLLWCSSRFPLLLDVFFFFFFLGMTIYRKELRGVDKFTHANLLLNLEGTNSPRRVENLCLKKSD